MKSPFPGMDPYLERRWQDVHQAICTYARDQIQEQLDGDLVARLGERLVVEAGYKLQRTMYPDVRVVEEGLGGSGGPPAAVLVEEAAEPMMIVVQPVAEPQSYIEISEIDSGELITVIEFISLSNKSGKGRRDYRKKQKELITARVNLVEIDLLRSGRRVFRVPKWDLPPAPYFACVWRGWNRKVFELYPIELPKVLPAIKVPLRKKDKDVHLRLQPLIDQAYRNGRYDRTDYHKPCVPPLAGKNAIWADDLLRARRAEH